MAAWRRIADVRSRDPSHGEEHKHLLGLGSEAATAWRRASRSRSRVAVEAEGLMAMSEGWPSLYASKTRAIVTLLVAGGVGGWVELVAGWSQWLGGVGGWVE